MAKTVWDSYVELKEKLVELLKACVDENVETDDPYVGFEVKYGSIADRLIADGWAKPEWISVKDRLPDKQEYDWVLVQLKLVPEEAYGVPCVAELRNGDWYDAEGCWIGTDPEGGCVIVTHWMPLPQPPKGE